ncbi:MAG: hypothetical protein REI96_21115 [Flavobacterium nitrogenifigens]|uniref:Uncharacterized protein n=1 Tax=Flavobacterium nitrogenifigens TaxID=1617283 RepID=A0A521BJ14_9FLAO|nr:hypothetical protein [Flavobacterium nitrogenifigens]KAF2330937.1 hypothetical protein DM397_14210 [Flavobacterium nitrogenifigens]MDQ8014959.1 hypothetical protein [Flavobacterium nitrogenifigens]SMO47049.1 hypothetical protein SAMN06265220_1011041 [Flavobacterium nitrogenifigens]
MRNNPFITVILLFCIEIVLYNYMDYMNLISSSSAYRGSLLPLFCFTVPAISILISILFDDMPYKKEFRYFCIFLAVVSIITFIIFSYFAALGKAYQH